MPSRSSRSTDRARSSGRRPAGVDVYLLPAIVGGGLGDIDEVLCAGRYLARAGLAVFVYRAEGRPLPPGVDGPWAWPKYRSVVRLRPEHDAALTVAPAWGVSAAPPAVGPLGRAGPWAEEAAAIERTYGPERTLHASLEEFARTLTSSQESGERFREGGVPSRRIAGRKRDDIARGTREEFRKAFRRFRAFDRPNVAHFFAGFAPSRGFAREYPEAIQTGPLWPRLFARPKGPAPSRARWVWYASPASAQEVAGDIVSGLRDARAPPLLTIRSSRSWSRRFPREVVEIVSRPLPGIRWRRRFATAELRIVTGSRSLLEALELGGPFLYFNGVLGRGAGRRRHRPEKIDALLALGRRRGWPTDLLRDLSDFARGRRIREVVRRAVRRDGAWADFPSTPVVEGYPAGRESLGDLLVRVAQELGRPGSSAPRLVGRLRSGGPF